MAHLPFIDAHPYRFNHAFIAQLRQRAPCAVHRLTKVVRLFIPVSIKIAVVNKRDIDMLQRHALQTVFDGSHRCRIGVIKDRLKRQRVDPHPGINFATFFRLQQTTDLSGQHILIAWIPAQTVANPRFAQTMAIQRRGIKIAQTVVPRLANHVLRFLFTDGTENIANWRGTVTHCRNLNSGTAKRILL